MKDFQQRKKIRKALYSKTTAIVLTVITLILARGAYGVVMKERETSKNATEVQGELDRARARNQELNTDINYLDTQSGVEREIREKYSVSKPGEDMVVLVDNTATSSSQVAPKKGIWGKIVDWFRGL